MAIECQTYQEDVFIDSTGDPTYYKKSGKRVVESVLNRSESFGLVGSDVVDEWFYEQPELSVKVIGPMINDRNDRLRFATIAPDGSYDPSTVVTSYPNTARRILGRDMDIIEAKGGIEAEVDDLEVLGFELVQTGESIRVNGTTVVVDNLAQISLCRVQRKLS